MISRIEIDGFLVFIAVAEKEERFVCVPLHFIQFFSKESMNQPAYEQGQQSIQKYYQRCEKVKNLDKQANQLDDTSTSMSSYQTQGQQIYSRAQSKIILMKNQLKNNAIVVKKTPRLCKSNSQSFHQIHEVEFSRMLQKFPQEHLISIHHVTLSAEGVNVGMEYACRGNLTQLVLQARKLVGKTQKLEHLKRVKSVLWEVVQGLSELHGLGYVHRDIKPDNILINHLGNIKLCDFQFVGPIGIIDNSYCGTPEYMPPERLTDKRNSIALDSSIDMWAVGVLAFQLLMGQVPYPLYEDDDVANLVNSMYEDCISFSEDYPNYCRHFVFNLLQTNLRKRMTLEKVKKHQFFTIDFENPDNPAINLKCDCK